MRASLFVYEQFKSDSDTFESNFKDRTTEIINYSVKVHSTSVGEFSLTVKQPMDILPDNILRIVDMHHVWWLIARHIVYDDENLTMTVTGTDLKGLLQYRNTLYASEAQDVGTYGYDVVQGYTGTCCVHYVKNNCIDPEVPQRKIYGLTYSSSSLNKGKPSTTYRARFESVSDVVHKICENDGVCWDIVGDLHTNKFVFFVYEPTDRSAEQTEHNQVVFSITRKNVLKFQREIGNTEHKNVFYATKSGGTLESDAYTAVVYRDETTIPSGLERKEMHLNVSCDEFSEVDMYALYEATDYVETDSIQISVSNVQEFEKEYFLGDKITAFDYRRQAILNTFVKSVQYSRGNGKESLSLTFGTEKPKLLRKIINKIENGVK